MNPSVTPRALSQLSVADPRVAGAPARAARQRGGLARQAWLAAAALVAGAAAVSVSANPAAAQQEQFDPYPDDGLPAIVIDASPLVSERTEILQSGVSGINEQNDSFTSLDAEVLGIVEIDGVMYIGGKFTDVLPTATAPRVRQRFLAAFDRETGAWIDSFRPQLDGNVWDLAATDDGRLVVAGQFTNVNGEPNTAAIALLDPHTGEVDPTWRVSVVLTGSTRRALVRAVEVHGNDLYLAGNFTRVTGPDGDEKRAANLVRVGVDDAIPDGAFLPTIDGVVFDVDVAGDRVYGVGNFLYVNGEFSPGEAKLSALDGSLLPGLAPYVPSAQNVSRRYLQAVLPLGDEVWYTGSEHLTQVYRASDFSLLRSYVSMPFGDGQAIVELGGIVYKGSHANQDTYEYVHTTDYPRVSGATSKLPVRWIGAWDPSADSDFAHLDWYPQIGTSNGEGAWVLYADSVGCLWAGGDFNRGSFDGDTPRFVRGFARFCAADTVAPEPPTNPVATLRNDGVYLSWDGSTDDRGGEVRYELLKNDRVFASFISIQTFRDPDGTDADRYFVRAMDTAGNRSATTRVFSASSYDTTRPSTPGGLSVATLPNEADGGGSASAELTWEASTDNVGVERYLVFDTGEQIAEVTGTGFVDPAPAAGSHWYQVQAVDAAGNTSFRTPPQRIEIAGADQTPPTTPQNLVGELAVDGSVALEWTPSADDTAVIGYRVYLNGDIIAEDVAEPMFTVTAPRSGSNFFQVQALDAAGNESFKTPPTEIEVAAGDVHRPTTPRELAGVFSEAGALVLTWAPSTDDVGVDRYVVTRNNEVVADDVVDPTFTIATPLPGTGWYQVRAVDAAGNESFKTPPLPLETPSGTEAVDTRSPSVPRDLAGVVDDAGAVALSWAPSTDDVGVTRYIVYRNNVVLAEDVTETSFVVAEPGSGAGFYQVQAADAAGNTSVKTAPVRIDPAEPVPDPDATG